MSVGEMFALRLVGRMSGKETDLLAVRVSGSLSPDVRVSESGCAVAL
jgi:hypothetical protein